MPTGIERERKPTISFIVIVICRQIYATTVVVVLKVPGYPLFFTVGTLHLSIALLALDPAAPNELTIALLNIRLLERIVAPPTAQVRASLGARRLGIAKSTVSPVRSDRRIFDAKARIIGRLQVDEIEIRRRHVISFGDFQLAAARIQFHFHRTVELVFDDGADLVKISRQFFPAGLDRAGAAQTMATTISLRLPYGYLRGRGSLRGSCWGPPSL